MSSYPHAEKSRGGEPVRPATQTVLERSPVTSFGGLASPSRVSGCTVCALGALDMAWARVLAMLPRTGGRRQSAVTGIRCRPVRAAPSASKALLPCIEGGPKHSLGSGRKGGVAAGWAALRAAFATDPAASSCIAIHASLVPCQAPCSRGAAAGVGGARSSFRHRPPSAVSARTVGVAVPSGAPDGLLTCTRRPTGCLRSRAPPPALPVRA